MRQDEIDEIRSCILTDKTKFHYFKDRYALMLLAWVAKDGVAVGNVKRSRFGRLMQKRIPREVASRAPNGLLTRTSLESFWPQQTEVYLLTLGQWGETGAWCRNWQQTSRPGLNLVLHVNFSNKHNAPYRKLMRGNDCHPFRCHFHPNAPEGHFTLAWARFDVDLKGGEAIIEEIQNDWLRNAQSELNWLQTLSAGRAEEILKRQYGEPSFTVEQLKSYIDQVLGPHQRIWDEATLAASLWVLRDVIGIRRVYYHTFEGGNRLKRLTRDRPPRSLYSTLPKRFCFDQTSRQPKMLVDCRHRRVRRELRLSPPRWFIFE